MADLGIELGALHDRLPGGRQCGAEPVPLRPRRVGVITPGVMATLASACSYPGWTSSESTPRPISPWARARAAALAAARRTSFTLMGVNVSELSGACELQARAASRCRVGCAEPGLVECDLFIRM